MKKVISKYFETPITFIEREGRFHFKEIFYRADRLCKYGRIHPITSLRDMTIPFSLN